MKNFFRSLRRSYRDYIPNIAVLFLFPVSCWSTFSGIRELMRSTGGVSDAEGLFVSIGLTMGIQITLLLAVSSVVRARNAKRPLYFAIYCLTVFFSVLFGYAFYFQHLQADDFARGIHQRESQRLLLEAEDYGARFEATARSLSNLASFSQSQSDLEDRLGGTCGDNSPSGRGPRARGRREDAEVFNKYDQDVQFIVSDLKSEMGQLRDDVGEYQAANVAQHHHKLEVFYQRLTGQRSRATSLMAQVKSYIDQRFPAGRYTIRESGQTYGCPDSRLEHLAALVQGEEFPPLTDPPQKFEANNPKAVVRYALGKMTAWTTGALQWLTGGGSPGPPPQAGTGLAAGGSLQGPVAGESEAAGDNLPLLLGLLVDCLIFLAAFASREGRGLGRSSLARLEELASDSPQVPDQLRNQLAGLLSCSPVAAKFAAYKMLRRYEMRGRPGLKDRLQGKTPSSSYVAVPKTGAFLERFPEVSRLEDLVRLLEALDLAGCSIPNMSWADLPAPLPPGLAEIHKKAKSQARSQLVEIYELNPRLMGDLVTEAFQGGELAPQVEPTADNGEPGDAAPNPVSV